MKTYLLTHDFCLKHNAGAHHPERAERLQAILDTLAQRNIVLEKRIAQKVSVDYLGLAHTDEHIEKVMQAQGKETVFDADTRANEYSVDAALYAAGAGIEAVDLVLQDPTVTAFCAVRPPGHHAESNRVMGFCLFNSVAIAAAYAIKHKGLERILIFDPDVHHGNGTQEIFYERGDVFYVSIHQYPHFPGTGRYEEKGAGDGLGKNANYPLHGGEGDETYIYLAQNAILDIIKDYQPQLILFSAGFDAHELDPLGGMQVTDDGFCKMYSVIMNFARAEKIPFLYTLEGGYSLEALSSSVALLLETITTENWPQISRVTVPDYIKKMIDQKLETIYFQDVVMKLIFTLFLTVFVFLQAEDYMTLHVDATDLTRGLLTSEIEIHTSDTEIVMWYPKWIPGIHGPRNPVENLGGVYFYSEEGNKLKWHRDSHEPFRFTCKLDQDTKKVRIKLRYICNQPNGNSTGVDSYGNSQMGIINWNTVLLYPAWKNNQIKVVTKLTLPNNWKFATALQTDAEEKQTVTFKETTLEELIDCPLICGQYLRTIDLKVEDFPPHYLHLVAESSSDLNIPEDLIQKYRRCIQQAQKIFFKPHFRKYHFLVFMSDRLPSMGLEHLSSSLNGIGEKDFFTEWSLKGWVGSLLPHEYVHSWCGKYRRPIGMHTPDYHSNKDTRLLWIYEGLTTYLGEVLAVRSGFLTPEDYIPRFTRKLNYLIKQTGRSWRPLEDTCVCSYTLRQRSENWGVWRRGQDYYDEGLLLWLEIDTMIRHRSFGEKSLDDFCIQFFGKGNSGQVLAFDLLEVYQILDNIVQYDWKNFIEGRIKEPKEKLPLNLVNLCGYRMIYTNKASGYLQELQRRRKYIDASDSLGILFSYDGQIRKIIPGMVGDLSGIAPGMQVTGINGQKFTVSNLENAIANSIVTGKIELLVFERYTYKILTLKYDGGAKYLRLERVPNSADMLTKILRPVKQGNILKVTFLGTGTSQGVPVPMCECRVCRSADHRDQRLRTSVYIEYKNTHIIIDSGPDFRQQLLREKINDLDGLIFTHSHHDHIAGLDDIRCFNFKYKRSIGIYTSAEVEKRLREVFSYIFAEVKYPGAPQVYVTRIKDKAFKVKRAKIIPLQVLHGKLPIFGFRIGDFTYLTDTSFIPESENKKIQGSKVIVLDALRKEPHPTHLHLDAAINIIKKFQPQKAYFIHMSHQMGLHEEVEKLLPDGMHLAYDGLKIQV